MRLELERRPERSRAMALLSPLIAVALTVAAAAAMLAAYGISPLTGLQVYFVEPLTSAWSLQELLVKASPLVLIAVGLSLCFLSNTWNIGAEGQYIAGASLGGWLALSFQDVGGPWLLPSMLVLGAVGGAFYGLVPAVLRVCFGANEILTSLMLVYVARLGLDYLVRGPWRDPQGYNFPQTVTFNEWSTMPALVEGSRLHLGVAIGLLVVVAASVVLGRMLGGFEIRVVGMAPRAARFAGFDDRRMILVTFAVSGALAGLAGLMEIAGPIGQILPTISPGYGFTAIIVAFLGRLNPIGILVAGLVLALSVLGGESAQIALQVPLDLTSVLQGLLLFFVLACDTLILYRIRLAPTPRRAPHVAR
jgi:ABC-type uncharacterized transport system permease subunit